LKLLSITSTMLWISWLLKLVEMLKKYIFYLGFSHGKKGRGTIQKVFLKLNPITKIQHNAILSAILSACICLDESITIQEMFLNIIITYSNQVRYF